MADHLKVYKRYSTQLKRNSILTVKQKQAPSLSQNHIKQENLTTKNSPQFKAKIIFQSAGQRKLEPLLMKKFEEYFKKSIELPNNSKVFNEFIQHKTIKTDKKRKIDKIMSYTSANITNTLETADNLDRKKFIKQRRIKNFSSISQYEPPQLNIEERKDSFMMEQNFTDPNQSDKKFQPITFISQKTKKKQKLHQSIDLSKLLNKTLCQESKNVESQLSSLLSRMKNVQNEQEDYLKIQSSTLIDRKTISPILKTNHTKKVVNKEEIRKNIKNNIQHRNQAYQKDFKNRLKIRSFSPSKISRKVHFLDFINPLKRQEFTLLDVIKVSLANSMIDEVKFHMNGCFFTVYVQDGNNSQLLKSIVRSTNGWRVSQLIEVSNLVWTQNYRKNLAQKKPKKIFKQMIAQNQKYQNQIKQKGLQDFRETQKLLLSRVSLRKNQNSNSSFQQKSLQKISNIELKKKISFDVQNKNYPELSLSRNHTQFQQKSYLNQLRKLLPVEFDYQNFMIKSAKDGNKMIINPNLLIHNHLIGHREISDKKNLLFNLRKYYFTKKLNPFEFIPQSHDIFSENDDYVSMQNQNFLQNKEKSQQMKKQVWIVKPGEDSNRGRGIVICKGWQSIMSQIRKRFKQNKQSQIQESTSDMIENQQNSHQNQKNRKIPKKSVILQKYLMPLLYNGRKFDIRSYMLVTYVNNVLNAYFYEQCYIRTSSKLFNIDSQNKYVHLTNDAVQSVSHQYGKYEEGNKVSELIFSKYFESLSNNPNKSWNEIKTQMSQRCKDILKSSSKKLVGKYGIQPLSSVKQIYGFGTSSDFNQITQFQSSKSEKGSFLFPNSDPNRQQVSFQLFGLDFMIDDDFKLWLIEVNTNPAISHGCSKVLNRLIPKLLQNTFAIAVMPFMRPSKIQQNIPYQNCYRHIYQQKFTSQL